MLDRIFSADNPFNVFMTLVFDIILLHFLYLICCIPIITIGASTTALYTVMLKRAKNDEGYIFKGFFKAFKENFKQSVPLTLLFLLITAILVGDFLIMTRWEISFSALFQGLCCAGAVILAGIVSYVWPLMAKFSNTNRMILNNAWRLAVVNLPRTILLVALHLLPLVLFLFFPQIFAEVWWIWAFFGFGLTAYFCAKIINPVFDKLIESQEGIQEENLEGGRDEG